MRERIISVQTLYPATHVEISNDPVICQDLIYIDRQLTVAANWAN